MSQSANRRHLDADGTLIFCDDALQAAGAEASVAEKTARGLWLTSLRGIDSHGIRLLPHYVRGLRGGRLNGSPDYQFKTTAAATGILDADHTLGHAAGMVAIDHAIDLARDSGVGMVAIQNSSHCGMLAYFALEACRHDMIGLAVTHATARLCTANGMQPFFGNNPFCLAAPMADDDPFCYDGAMSSVTMNEVRRRAAIDEELPVDAAADVSGNATLNAQEAIQLLPIGSYKGFGLAMVVDILCALLTTMPAGPDVSDMFADSFSEPRQLGQMVGAIRIDAFLDQDEFKRQLAGIAKRVREEPARDAEVAVQVPGDPEKLVERQRRKHGIPIPDGDLEMLTSLAADLDIDAPLERNAASSP